MSCKTAVLGGSFDPVHLGHIFLLHNAIQKTDYERFILIPAFLSNFKQNSGPVATDVQRIEMLNLAVNAYRRLYSDDRKTEIEISDMEIKRKGISFTSTTVKELKRCLNLEKIGLIMGDDHIEKLSSWYEFEYLKKNVQFIICPRENKENIWNKLPHDIDFIKLDVESTSPESSTSVRNDSAGFSSYLPEEVLDYVRKNNLYN